MHQKRYFTSISDLARNQIVSLDVFMKFALSTTKVYAIASMPNAITILEKYYHYHNNY